MRKVGEELDAQCYSRELAVCSWFGRGCERVASFPSHCQALLPFAVRPRPVVLQARLLRAGSLACETTRLVASLVVSQYLALVSGFPLTKTGGGERLVACG